MSYLFITPVTLQLSAHLGYELHYLHNKGVQLMGKKIEEIRCCQKNMYVNEI
ncbi:hypothetical protein DPMN_086453 [Dreissena polymorpha]|uniref:Uncharacterized protein n=1 Tax=Dreissena polymorpha TaxID=45954 RepID=A0A9D4QV75_DREPO|nr:hypothetical protein DPMN_086453 [Dreissena polymorpha]